MKKFLFLIASCLTILSARAEMKIMPNSFHDFAAKNVQTQGGDLGNIQNAGLVNVPISSEPPGATVFFDGKEMPIKTPLTIKDVKIGAHCIALSPADPSIANSVQEHVVQVTSSQHAFNFNMSKTKEVRVKADSKNAYITVIYNGQEIARGVGEVNIPKACYGAIYHINIQADGFTNEADLQINDCVPSVVEYKVKRSKKRTR